MNTNEKIAKWLGFKIFYDDKWDTEHKNPMFIPSGKPNRTHMIDAIMIPDFQNDFNACLKWAVPKLDFINIVKDIDDKEFTVEVGVIVDKETCGYSIHFAEHESLPTAFTDALEKLISEGKGISE